MWQKLGVSPPAATKGKDGLCRLAHRSIVNAREKRVPPLFASQPAQSAMDGIVAENERIGITIWPKSSAIPEGRPHLPWRLGEHAERGLVNGIGC
jgi:hypothetical protein